MTTRAIHLLTAEVALLLHYCAVRRALKSEDIAPLAESIAKEFGGPMEAAYWRDIVEEAGLNIATNYGVGALEPPF